MNTDKNKIQFREIPAFTIYTAKTIGSVIKTRISESYHKRPTIFATIYLIAMSYGLFNNIVNYKDYEKDYEKIYQSVIFKYDLNHDGNMTDDEWAKAYNAIGKKYDARDPEQLSINNLEDMLKK